MMGFKSPAQRFTNNTYEIDGIFEHYLGAAMTLKHKHISSPSKTSYCVAHA